MARERYVQGTAAEEIEYPEREQGFGVEKKLSSNSRRPKYITITKTAKRSSYSIGQVLGTVVIALLVTGVLAGYVSLNSDVVGYRKQKTALQSAYEQLKVSNDQYEERIINAVDLQEIERVAVCELGMHLAGSGQIVQYSGDIDDYVKQYDSIP